MLLPMLLMIAQDASNLQAALAAYREKTRADVPCRATSESDEIVVCALRDADRYRVPFVERGAGRENARLREARLLDPQRTPCGQGAFLVHCGKMGVTATIDSRGAHWEQRPLAP